MQYGMPLKERQAGDNMLSSQKNVFWEALIIAIFIFGSGLLLGFFLEGNRVANISQQYERSEISLLDVKIQTESFDLKGISCEELVSENILFGDRIYEESRMLDRYESANKLTGIIAEYHKKYDLLRALFWINSMKIKERCGNQFNTIVYLYDYNAEKIEEVSKQSVFSKYLFQLKERYGNKILLIPIAKNLNLKSIEFLIKKYNVTDVSVIIDEKKVITEIEDLTLIPNYLL